MGEMELLFYSVLSNQQGPILTYTCFFVFYIYQSQLLAVRSQIAIVLYHQLNEMLNIFGFELNRAHIINVHGTYLNGMEHACSVSVYHTHKITARKSSI